MNDLSPENREHWLQAAGGLTPVIESELASVRRHASEDGYDVDRATVTYEDRFECGDIFNNRVVRYRVPRRADGVLRRYTVYAYTYQEAYWQCADEDAEIQRDREYTAHLGRLDDLSDEEMVNVFGEGNTPNRAYLSARPQELEYRASDWPPVSGASPASVTGG